jgi:hypothetical protein
MATVPCGWRWCRVTDRPFPGDALTVRAIIEPERGRWVLTLEIVMVPDTDDYIVRHRIADYATRERAEVAAKWIVSAANRNLPHPPLGF